MLNPIYLTCCGIDVHKKNVVACVLKTSENGQYTDEIRTYGTMTSDLENLKAWLVEEGCTHVAMESTGVYWIPVYNILEDSFEITLANAKNIKNVPGRKTDRNDSRWIAKLLALGLINGSFIPPKDIRELRELTRYRDKLIVMRTSEKNRVQKILENCNIKLSCVASDVFGVSGMAILNSLIEQNEDAKPEELAELAKGRLRSKIPDLMQALNGKVDKHHASMLKVVLEHLAFIAQSIAEIEIMITETFIPVNS